MLLGWPKSSFFKVKIKDTIFIFTNNLIQQVTHHFVTLPSAIFQGTSQFHLPKIFIFLSKELFQMPFTVFQGIGTVFLH